MAASRSVPISHAGGLLTVGGGDELYSFAADLAKAGAGVQLRAFGLVKHHGTMLRTRIQAHASGRPGPRAPTGDYRRSWAEKFTITNGNPTVYVGTHKPQGRRLEMGFVGADSLGRVYRQPPYPHVAPAFAETWQAFADDLGDAGVPVGLL